MLLVCERDRLVVLVDSETGGRLRDWWVGGHPERTAFEDNRAFERPEQWELWVRIAVVRSIFHRVFRAFAEMVDAGPSSCAPSAVCSFRNFVRLLQQREGEGLSLLGGGGEREFSAGVCFDVSEFHTIVDVDDVDSDLGQIKDRISESAAQGALRRAPIETVRRKPIVEWPLHKTAWWDDHITDSHQLDPGFADEEMWDDRDELRRSCVTLFPSDGKFMPLPSGFSSAEYGRLHSDLDGFDPSQLEWHYIRNGQFEGRSTGRRTRRSLDGTPLPVEFHAQLYAAANGMTHHHPLEAVCRHWIDVGRASGCPLWPKTLPVNLYHDVSDKLINHLLSIPDSAEQAKAVGFVNKFISSAFREPTRQELQRRVVRAGKRRSERLPPASQFDVCVCLHIGFHTDEDTLAFFARLYGNVVASGLTSRLFVTVFDPSEVEKVRSRFSSHAEVLVVGNKGLDIGPFIKTLHHIATRKLGFAAIFKWHSKRDLSIRTPFHETLAGTPEAVRKTFRLLVGGNSDVGMVCHKMLGNKNIHPNHPWLALITARLRMHPFCIHEQQFAACTVFACRFDTVVAHIKDLVSVLDDCGNTASTVDWVWYCRTFGVALSPFNARTIVDALGGSPESAWPFMGHPYWERGSCGHDGMFEHAMERVFGCIVRRHRLRVAEVGRGRGRAPR